MSYQDQLKTLRNARSSRDQANQDLYNSLQEYLVVQRRQKKAGRGEIVDNNNSSQSFLQLKGNIAEKQKEIQQANARIAVVNSMNTLLLEKQNLIEQLNSEINNLQQHLLNELLQSSQVEGNIIQEGRQKKDKFDCLKKKVENLGLEIQHLQKEMGRFDPLEELILKKSHLEQESVTIYLQLEQWVKKSTQNNPDERSHLDELLKKISAQKENLNQTTREVKEIIGRLHLEKTPQQLIEEWNDNTPIMLLPVRIETRFKTIGERKQLWVRVFPDEIAIVNHEKAITKSELDYGIAHWKSLLLANGNKVLKTASWKILTDKFGTNRAAWIAIKTKPINWEDSEIPDEQALVFPVPEITKADAWTEAPHTKVMPDKFVLLGYRKKKLVLTQVGTQLRDIVITGPAPSIEPDKPSITRNDVDNTIDFGEDFKWVADFDEAEKIGLGFRVMLDADSATQGFDQFLVVGLKSSADEQDGKILIEDLLNSHQYSQEGLSFIQQGTPTNNTEEVDSGHSQSQSIDDIGQLIETDQVLFTYTSDINEAKDGQRLAEYLGLDHTIFQSVQNSNISDHTEAVAMNKALYASTLGYYMHSMLNEVVPDKDLIKLRNHFTNFVTGRGPLPSIKIGKQPYGFIVTSAFSKWKYPPGRLTTGNFSDTFYPQLFNFLQFLQEQWLIKSATLPHISKAGNAGDNLMKVLGLHPNSTEFFQRVAYSFDYFKNLETFEWGGEYFEDHLKLVLDQIEVNSILGKFGYKQINTNGTYKPVPLLLQLVFQHYHTQLENKNLIDGQPLSEENLIKNYDTGNTVNYIDWLLANAADAKKLESQDFGTAAKPNSVLFMMLQHSLLLESSVSIYQYFQSKNIAAKELITSRKFMNISSAPTVSHWEVFNAPVNRVVTSEASVAPVYEFIWSKINLPDFSDYTQNLKDTKWALEKLKHIPTARLERALVEHIDTLSYRLDAWQTSLFDLRLQEQRLISSQQGEKRTGIYIGSYGYLENVVPGKNIRTKISEDILPTSLQEKKDNLYSEKNNGGYVQAPTLNHATAAAILRNGYLTHATRDEKELLSVNLSSERVRRAKYLIDGIRNGQTLEVLLGYQFERGLHDLTTQDDPIILDHLKPLLRQAFPIKKTKVPQAGKTTGPEETTDDFSVVNGLALARLKEPFPYGITFPVLSTAQIEGIKQQKLNIENTLDALRDVLTSESAYQLALGNFDRAAAVMQSISSSTLPPEIEVIDSSKGTGFTFTNKVVVHFDPLLSENPWPTIPFTQKAITEPGLNHWIGGLIGMPNKIECLVSAIDNDGQVMKKPDNSLLQKIISLEDLNLQPIDFIYLIRNKLEESGTSELETRIRYFFASENNIVDDVVVKIEFTKTSNEADLSLLSFGELLPLANYLRELISSSKGLVAKDYEPASKKITTSDSNPNNIHVADLKNRIDAVSTYFNVLIPQLKVATTDAELIKSEALVNVLRDKLKAVADAGFVFAFPQSAFGTGQVQIDTLVTQGKSVVTRFETIKSNYLKKITEVNLPATKPDQQSIILADLIKTFLGDDYKILPRFDFNNTTDIGMAYSSRSQLLKFILEPPQSVALPVFEWMHGVSLVRPKIHQLEMIRILSESFGTVSISGEPIQVPYKKDDTWLAVEFAPETSIDHDTLSFLQITPQGFDATKPQCGLVIDDWVEVIPSKEEVTGITFNYNQPNSVPPQAILVAVTPEQTGHWKWENLTETILDTFDRAKTRAVEPDQIDSMPGISTLLPGIISEFSTSKSGISLDYSMNIQYVMNEALNLFSLKK